MSHNPSAEGIVEIHAAVDAALLRRMYTRMLLIRYFEEEIQYCVSHALIHGTTHLYVGEEAVAVGAIANLDETDYITSTHRGHGHAIAKGSDLNRMMAEMFGKRAGTCGGKGGSMHIADLARGNLGGNGIVGGGLPLAAGAGLSIKLLGQDRIVVCFFGDGAMNEGAFHESVNLASVWKLPVIFLCENNQYGVSTHVRQSSNVEDLAERAGAYGIPGRRVDGMDVLEMYHAVRDAKDYVRRNGPLLLVAQTYRYLGHSKSDVNAYRTEQEILAWRARDPIPRFRAYLLDAGFCSEDELSKLEERARMDVEAAVRFAQSCEDPGLDDLLSDVYAD